MAKGEKVYIGSGKTNKFISEIVDVTIPVENVLANQYDYKGKKFITFAVAPRQQVDKFGKTHRVYVFVKEEQEKPKAPTQVPFAERKVAELRAILKGRGLDHKGNKEELVARLETAE